VRPTTIARHRGRLTRLMVHIEDNLNADLSLAKLAGVAGLSRYRLHHVFSLLAQESLGDYVNRMRLERAAFQLAYSETPVAAIALDQGYDNPSSFTRAFTRQMGFSPQRFRRAGLSFWELRYPGIPPVSMADIEPPKFRWYPPQRVLFMRRTGSSVGAAEQACQAVVRALHAVPASVRPENLLGITPDYEAITPSGRMRYDACVPYDARLRLGAETGTKIIPGGIYAVFTYRGAVDDKQAVDDLWRYLYQHWAATSALKLRSSGAFERYPSAAGPLGRGQGDVELHVPVRVGAKKAITANKPRAA
jgi:AraC family transcriptional regulator